MDNPLTQRAEQLRAMSKEQVDTEARRLGITPSKNKLATIHAIERREFNDRRSANYRPHIKDLF